MRTIALVGCGVAVFAAACGARDPGATGPVPGNVAEPVVGSSEGRAPSLAELECEGMEAHLVPGYASRAALRAAFGAPERVEASTEPNRHVPGAVDSLFVVHYQGLTAQFRKPESGEDLVSYTSVSANEYLRYPRIGIGAPASRVRELLGSPTEVAPEGLVYSCGQGADQPVTFRLEDGIVRGVEISYYVD